MWHLTFVVTGLLCISCTCTAAPPPLPGAAPRAAPKRVTRIGCRKLHQGANGTCQACIAVKYALNKKTGNCDCAAGYGSWTVTSRAPGAPKGPWPRPLPPKCTFTNAATDKKAGCQCLKCPKGTSSKRPSPIPAALCSPPGYTPSVGLRVQLAVMSASQDTSAGLQAGFAQSIIQTVKGEYAQDAPAWVGAMTAGAAGGGRISVGGTGTGRGLTVSASPNEWTYSYDFVIQANASGTLDDLSSYRSSLAARVNANVCSVTPPGGTGRTACDMALLAAGLDPSDPNSPIMIKGAAASPLDYHNASSLPSPPPSVGSGACSGWGGPCDVASGQLCCVSALALVCELRPQATGALNTCVRADGYCRERPEDTCKADWECCGLACGGGRCTNATDACREGNGGCSALAACSGGFGASPTCTCPAGYSGDGVGSDGCKDVDECSDPLRPQYCDVASKADCVNTNGSYTCTCKDGYRQTANGGVTCTQDLCSVPGHCYPEGTASCSRGVCTCNAGYQGRDCRTSVPREPDECSPPLRPQYCDDESRADCTDLPNGYNCTCKGGYTTPNGGRTCTLVPPVDECSPPLRPQYCDDESRADCTDLPTGYNCTCKPGYVTADGGRTCTDIDECSAALRPVNCDVEARADCVNTGGNYSCTCKEGWNSTDGGKTCTDIDECSGGARPSYCDDEFRADCNNTVGGYSCTCKAGYETSDGGRNCTDVDECSTALRLLYCDVEARANCTNTAGNYSCNCKPGFSSTEGGKTCTDIDECLGDEGGSLCDAEPRATCTNTVGGYTCTCKTGYTTTNGGRYCADVDECSAALRPVYCDVKARADCTNTDGNYSCTCKAGFISTDGGKTCTDIDECVIGTDDCSPDSTCTNTIGSYSCKCKPGFSGNGFSCSESDECALGTDRCSPYATCTNTLGGYNCTCKPGTKGDGFSCYDIDECKNSSTCSGHGDCTNTQGWYNCNCEQGWRFDGVTCVIDKCFVPGYCNANGTASCSYEVCHCKQGYSGTDCSKGGQLKCWTGSVDNDWKVAVPSTLGPVIDVSASCGFAITCAITAHERVAVCFGGSFADNRVYYRHPNAPVKMVATGSTSPCALLDTGAVNCWGEDAYLQLSTFPSELGLPGAAKWVCVGEIHACAVTAAGAVRCWGWVEQSTDGRMTVPQILQQDGSAEAVSCGCRHTCVLTANATVVCFGSNDYGESTVPADLDGQRVTAVSTAVYTTCVTLKGYRVRCFGLLPWDPSETAAFLGYNETRSISAGGNCVAALTLDGELRAGPVGYPPGLSDGKFPSKALVVALAPGGDHACAITAA